ncbi:MAG: efflux RND transporter periplasmic adaptor subunit [Planctomycetaceae bacterium]|nr:efflux RND transporter periplasmic adaptor subunit [Planctomycetaceae bacterium]
MKLQFPSIRIPVGVLWTAGLVIALAGGSLTFPQWWPPTQKWVRTTIAGRKKAPLIEDHHHGPGGHAAHEEDVHDHGDHGHAHDDSTSLELSKQALGNIGLTGNYLRPVVLETFRRAITVPAIVVERPGRTKLKVSTPMAGVITHVHAVRGEAIEPGSLLFELRITAEELVSTQTELLKTLGDLEVENKEIKRLSEIAKSGAIAEKTLLERQYAKDKLEVLLSAHKEALRLQGLSERQVNEIVENRRLLRDLQIVAPSPDDHSHEELRLSGKELVPVAFWDGSDQDHPHPHPPLILEDVLVHKGEIVTAGTTLAIASDMAELYIEGRAFEQDSEMISHAAAKNWGVTAIFERAGNRTEKVPDLELLYAASGVNEESRTLPFYVRLPNNIVREVPSPNGLKYVEWKYRPGQRLELRVPVEEWEKQIVLPVEAVAQEGAETYVFQQNGNHFDRVPVQVVYRDQNSAVIKNDGSLFPGDVIAYRGAHQMQMALKNKSGGGVDPHAGHTH